MAETATNGIKEDEVLSSLFKACAEGDVQNVRDIIDNNPSLNLSAFNADGDTVMHVAASAGQIDVAKQLKSKGVALDVTNATKDTPLHSAAKSGQVPFIAYLKEQEINVNTKNEAEQTAVHIAAKAGFADVIEWLLHSLAADCNPVDVRGCTPLHVACEARQTYAALVLLHSGCHVDIVDQSGMTPLHIACRNNLLAVVQAMCGHSSAVDKKTQDGMTPLHLAAKDGNPELVRYLVLAGADIDEYNADGIQAEEIARAQGHTEVADLLSQLTSSIVRDRGETYARQLAPTTKPFNRIRVNILGNSSVGKTTLIESLKCGYIKSLFRRGGGTMLAAAKKEGAGQNAPAESVSPSKDRVHVDGKSSGTGKVSLQMPPANLHYTRGIDVQQVNINAVGDVSIWEYSGYEPYYVVYDRFLGDPNAIYVVVISLRDDVNERRKQIDFWLNFIRTRTMPFEPIGFGGAKLWVPRVLLVATHADIEQQANKTSSRSGKQGKSPLEENTSPDFELLDGLYKTYYADIALEPHVFRMDAHQANGAEMKLLRQTMAGIKKFISESLPPTLGILDATVSNLSDWRRVLAGFPVVSWPTFMEYIRSRVNVLATEDHLRELVSQLHVIGEVISVAKADQEMIVVSPRWLGTEIIGRLLAYDCFVQSPKDGRFGIHELQSIFPKCDPKDISFVLDSMELLYGNTGPSGDEYVVINFDSAEQPPAVAVGKEEVVGGFHITPQFNFQLLHVFSRIIYALRARLQATKPDSATDAQAKSPAGELQTGTVIHWNSGARVTRGKMTADIRLIGAGSGLIVSCRGPAENRKELFFFQEDICEVIYTALEACCPALYLERAPISAIDLKSGKTTTPHVYSPRVVAMAQLAGTQTVRRDVTEISEPEQLADLVAFGCAEIFARLRPGIEQSVSSLSLYARYRLAALLDPKDGRKKGWKALAALLGLAAEAGTLESEMEQSGEAVATVSPTDLMLAEWSRNVGEAATIRALHGKLLELDRPDVIDALLSVVPLYRYVSEDGGLGSATGSGLLRRTTPSTSSAGSTSTPSAAMARPVSMATPPARPASTSCTTTL